MQHRSSERKLGILTRRCSNTQWRRLTTQAQRHRSVSCLTALHSITLSSEMGLNSVHADTNWRQRLQQEAASAAAWRDQWGFLEFAKPAGSVGYVDRQQPNAAMHRIIVEQGPMYPYLQKTHRE